HLPDRSRDADGAVHHRPGAAQHEYAELRYDGLGLGLWRLRVSAEHLWRSWRLDAGRPVVFRPLRHAGRRLGRVRRHRRLLPDADPARNTVLRAALGVPALRL